MLDRAVERGATIITPVSAFYGGYSLARSRDRWSNLWWLYARETADAVDRSSRSGETDWHDREPSRVHTTIVQVMRELRPPEAE